MIATSRGFVAWLVSLVLVVTLVACSANATPSTVAPTSQQTAAPVATASPVPSSTVLATASPSIAPAGPTAMASAPPSGVKVALVASMERFLPTTLAAPAGKTWQIAFDQQDDKRVRSPEIVKHNVAIANFVTTRASDVTPAQTLFKSPSYPLGKYTLDVPGLPAGTYTFWCTLHPTTMFGTVTLH